MRKLMATVSAIALAGGIAYAANLSYISGPLDPGNPVGNTNALIGNINTGVSGIIASIVSPIAATATGTQQVLGSIVVPTNTLVTAGQSLRMRCAGVNANNSDSKKVALNFGTGATVSSAAYTTAAGAFELELVVSAASPVTSTVYFGRGSTGVTVISPTAGTDTTVGDSLGGAVTVACVATTAGTVADVTLDDLIVEQVK